MKLSVYCERTSQFVNYRWNNKNDIRMGSRPGAGQVLRPIGQPNAGDASGGVSATKSPGGGQPPWKVW